MSLFVLSCSLLSSIPFSNFTLNIWGEGIWRFGAHGYSADSIVGIQDVNIKQAPGIQIIQQLKVCLYLLTKLT